MKRIIFTGLVLWSLNTFATETISVVSFNVENLFDALDDPENPRDDTYLPHTIKEAKRASHDALCEMHNSGFYLEQCKTLDWSEVVYDVKLKNIANVIQAIPNRPNIIVIPETENKKVLDDLVDKHLTGSGYRVVQLDTSDKPESRGIDVGILTSLPILGVPEAIPIDFKGDTDSCGKTRDILHVIVELPDSEPLSVFGVHFPSGRSPLRCRIRAMKTLDAHVSNLPDDSLVVAAGDFNFNCNETVSDAFGRLLRQGNWYVSPAVTSGCDMPGSSKFRDSLLDNWHTWSFLDMILVSKELSPSKSSSKNWFADLGSFQTYVIHPEQISVDRNNKGFIEPRRFDPATLTGVSDHWPVGIRLIPRRW